MHEPLTASLDHLTDLPTPSAEDWKGAAEAVLQGKPLEKLISKTFEGVEIHPLYTRDVVSPAAHAAPGSGDRRRGFSTAGYHRAPWKVSQELVAADATSLKAMIAQDLPRGLTELNIPFCPASYPDAQALSTALSAADLAKVSVFIQSALHALSVAAALEQAAQHQNVPLSRLTGCLGWDPLGPLLWDIPVDLDAQWKDAAALCQWSIEHCPGVRPLFIHGHHFHDAGAGAAQELAFTMAWAAEVFQHLTADGLKAEDLASGMRIGLSAGPLFFVEIAKFRAARVLFTRLLERHQVSPSPQHWHLHVRTSRWNKSLLDAHTNMLRTTSEAFAAVIGGCDSLHIGPFDEVFRAPDSFSRRIARNLHTILLEECELGRVIDPAGGAYAVEALTDALVEKAESLLQEIQEAGGCVAALQSGLIQKQVLANAEARRQALSLRRTVLVGVNQFPNAGETLPPRQPLPRPASPGVAAPTASACAHLTGSDRWKQVRADITRGVPFAEVSKALTQASSTIRIPALPLRRGPEDFERLRLAASDFASRTGSPPTVLQINIGPSRRYRLRADWTASFFATGGFQVMADTDFNSPDEAVAKSSEVAPVACVLTSDDETYTTRAVEFAQALRSHSPDTPIFLAGAPGEHEAAWRQAGVSDFVHVRVNALAFLTELLTRSGALHPET